MTAPIVEIVKRAAESIQFVRKMSGKDIEPMMHIEGADGQVSLVALAITGRGSDIARAARDVVLQMQPEHAVIMIEGWTTRKGLDPNDRDYRAVLAGALRPGQLPPHKRGEMLTVQGESTNGDEAIANYYIESDGGFTEEFSSWNEPEVRVSTRFRPLFMDRHFLRTLDPIERAIMVNDLGSEEALLEVIRRGARRALDMGAGGTIQEFEDEMERGLAESRQAIGWRGK